MHRRPRARTKGEDVLKQSNISRRGFVKGAGVVGALAGMTALAGCASGTTGGEEEPAAEEGAQQAGYDNTLSEDVEDLNLVVLGKDIKIACVIVAMQKGYYEEEKLNVATQTVSGGFPEAMPALSNGTADVLPFGSIPTCTYVGQGDDLVIFGGTVLNGSECVTLTENKDLYHEPEDFRGKKIGCFRMETGHMVTKSWLRENGIVDGEDVEFVLLENSAAEVAAVENGELDMCFVNSGYGYVAEQGGKCSVAFRPNELIGREFPCCRQSTNRNAFENKRSALIKFEIANLRAYADLQNDHEGCIAALVEYSGQPQEYVENVIYGTDSYTAAMSFEMDPYTDAVKDFYGNMVDNGDIEDPDKDKIDAHLDSSIYKAALDVLVERGENADIYEDLLNAYAERNTMGV